MATSNAANPRNFRSDDTSLVRAWEEFELWFLLSAIAPGWEANYASSGAENENRKCTITIDSVDYEGEQLIGSLPTEQADVEALGKAVVAYLESL